MTLAVVVRMLLVVIHPSSVAGSDGASLAQASLAKAKVAKTDAESWQLRKDIQEQVSSLSKVERLNFVAEIAKAVAAEDRPDERERTAFAAVALIRASETTPAEKAQAISRLFAIPELAAQKTAEGLLADIDVVKMPNGERRRDLSVYRSVLEEGAGVTQSRLINYLFQRLPIEAASWFVENLELPETERAMLRAELGQATQIQGNASAPWEPAAGPAMNNADRERKLRQWIVSPSWILQLLAKSLLEKYPPWQTPDLRVATQKVAAPKSVTLRLINPASAPGVSNPPPTPVHAAAPTASPVPTMPIVQVPAVVVERKSAVWPWLVGMLALVVIAVIALKRRA